MIQDSESDPLLVLSPLERLSFRLVSLLHGNPVTRTAMNLLQSTVVMTWVELGTSRIVLDHHFERFGNLPKDRAVLLISNHRSYFDMFVIATRLFKRYGRHRRVLFPVRAKFFYDNPLGLLVNIFVAYGAMYPPMVHDKSRSRWNRKALDIAVEQLLDPRVMLGIHPEGTRNKSDDPYRLLDAKPGCGELIYRSRPTVIPVFLQGFPRFGWSMILRNLTPGARATPIVHMVMGEPIDFTEEQSFAPTNETFLVITKKAMEQVRRLGEEEKLIRKQIQSGGQLKPD